MDVEQTERGSYMKLAEALRERADLNSKIAQIASRMENSTRIQADETPEEDIMELKKQLDGALRRLSWLVSRINLTNCAATVDGKTLTEYIAEKDMLALTISKYKDIVASARETERIWSRLDSKTVPTISVREWHKEIDRLSGELRKLDNIIQLTNWSTDLIE